MEAHTLSKTNETTTEALKQREGPVARTIEKQTAKLPSDLGFAFHGGREHNSSWLNVKVISLRCLIVFLDVPLEELGKLSGRFVDGLLKSLLGEDAEEAFHQVYP